MKIRSRFRGQVQLVEADYIPGAEPAAFFSQVTAARTDIPEGADCKFLAGSPGIGRPELAKTSEKLSEIIEGRNKKKPLVVVIRCRTAAGPPVKPNSTKFRVRSVVRKPHQVVEPVVDNDCIELDTVLKECASLLAPEHVAKDPVLRVKDQETQKMTTVENTEMLREVAMKKKNFVPLLYTSQKQMDQNKIADGKLRVRTIVKGKPVNCVVDDFTTGSDLNQFLDSLWEQRGHTRGEKKTFIKPWEGQELLLLQTAEELVAAVQSKPAQKPLRLVLRPKIAEPDAAPMEQ